MTTLVTTLQFQNIRQVVQQHYYLRVMWFKLGGIRIIQLLLKQKVMVLQQPHF